MFFQFCTMMMFITIFNVCIYCICYVLVKAGPIDCQKLTCMNGGTCVVHGKNNNKEKCVCSQWYKGRRCRYHCLIYQYIVYGYDYPMLSLSSHMPQHDAIPSISSLSYLLYWNYAIGPHSSWMNVAHAIWRRICTYFQPQCQNCASFTRLLCMAVFKC